MIHRTRVRILNPMIGQTLCFGFTAANVMAYLGYKEVATIMREKAWRWSGISWPRATAQLELLLEAFAPFISQPIIYGSINLHRPQQKHQISLHEISTRHDRFPWLIIPTTASGICSHTFWAVDDLFFDTSTNNALKRTPEVADWICGHEQVTLHARHYCLPSRNKRNRDNHPPYRDHSLKHFDHTSLVNFHDPIKINEKRDRPPSSQKE